ncbi:MULTISPECIES: response regulator transcription factor [Microbacterium]|uniref:response regulator transcription factor n=1 Tax=Microbacterium TaxID=33882 RepID=UPI0022F0ABA2|nr:response regulator transcription factor [Streptomyces sp. MS2A]
MHVLIAEDDRSVAEALAGALRRAGHEADAVSRGSDVLLRHRDVDLLLLDLGLEDTDGFDVLRRLRLVSDLPVIVVTARGDERSTVRSLRLGADDHLVKPVRVQEFLARVEAVARRRADAAHQDEIVVGDLRVDLAARRAFGPDAEIALTATEFALLGVLARRVGAAVSREQILDEVWGDAYAARSRSFDVHLTQLRQKLPRGDLIRTIRGYGYRLEAPSP